MEQDNNSKKQNNNYFVNFNPNDKFLYHRDFAGLRIYRDHLRVERVVVLSRP